MSTRYISIHTVTPESETQATEEVVHLAPWDLETLQFYYIQRGLLFHKPQIQQEGEFLTIQQIVDRLMKSFSKTLNYFAPFTGRITTQKHEDDNTISFFIDGKVVGSQFIHATTDIKVADVCDSLYISEMVRSLFPLKGVFNHEGVSQPLLAVQVTELVDGIFIACSMNHLVADGVMFWKFINSWSEICRALPLDHIPQHFPTFERWVLNKNDLPVRFHPSIEDKLVKPFSSPLLYHRMFHFTPQKIAQLKIQANTEQGTDNISSLQALLGHIWITATRARSLDPNQEVIHAIAAEVRTRLNPPLPEGYFGNATEIVIASAKAGELLERGLGWASVLLNNAIKSLTDAEIRKRWDSWIKNHLRVLPSIKVDAPICLMIGSSPRFDMYGNDFGWGRPIAVRGGQTYDGMVCVHPGSVERSIDVEISLSPKAMRSIEGYSDFT